MLTTLSIPRSAQHCTKRSPLNLLFLRREKRAQDGHLAPSELWVTSWESPLQSPFIGIVEESIGFDHCESDCEGEAGRAHNNKCLDLVRLSSYLQQPNSSPNQWLCLFAEPRQWNSRTQQNADLPDLGYRIMSLTSPGGWSWRLVSTPSSYFLLRQEC